VPTIAALLARHASCGEVLDLADGLSVDPATMESWSAARQVPATTIRDLLRGRGDVDPRGVRLRGACLVGPLDLVAESVQAERGAFFGPNLTVEGHGDRGVLRLSGTRVPGRLHLDAGQLHNSLAGGPFVAVDGLTYAGLPEGASVPQWLTLLGGRATYTPQPYQQLAAGCRAAGQDREARAVLIAQRRDELRRGDLTPAMRAWIRVTSSTLGYGYRPWLALVWLGAVAAVAIALAVMDAADDELALRVPRRFRIMVWSGVLAAAGIIVGFAVLLWWTGVPIAAAVLLVLTVLVFPVWLCLPILFGSGLATLDAAGARVRIYPWDRHRRLVPWTDITAAWIKPIDGHRYLHLALRDPDPYLAGGTTRRSALSNMLEEHGTPFLVYVSDDSTRANDAAMRAAVSRFTDGTIEVADEPPAGPVGLPDPGA
jgi:hypothetical protein